MLQLLISAAVSPDCFSSSSYLQGDIQARELVLNLVPQEPLDSLCTALTDTSGTAQIFFQNAPALGFPDFVSVQFTYFSGKPTRAIFSISSLTTAQIDELINIKVADYVVKIEKAADITGTLNSLSYMKIDVSSCWSSQVFAFNPLDGEESVEVRLVPNDCVIPGTARLAPFFTIRTNSTELTLAEFQVGEAEGDYKHPYVHNEVLVANLECGKIVDEGEREQCFAVVKFVVESQDYYFGIKLVYSTNGIDTNIIQDAGIYQTVGSSKCANASGIVTYVNPDGFFIYHQPFEQHEECLIGQTAVAVVLNGGITVHDVRLEYGTQYNMIAYRKKQYYKMEIDLSSKMGESLGFYPLFMQYDNTKKVRGSFYYQTEEVTQCFYEVILMITGDSKIQIEFRSHYFEMCKNISEEFEIMFVSRDLDAVYSETLNIELDPKIPIQFAKFTLGTNVKKLLKNNDIAEFTVRGASFYFAGDHIIYSKDVIFLVIQFSYFAVYFFGGLIAIMVILKKQNATD